MTDNEIIKALECCISDGYTCKECPYADTKHMIGDEYELMPNGRTYDEFSCDEWLKLDLFGLINRQKAEIERLDGEVEAMKKSMWPMIANVVEGQMADAMDFAKAEAIKEFTELLKTKFDRYGAEHYYYSLVDDVAKELVGEDNNSPIVDKQN